MSALEIILLAALTLLAIVNIQIASNIMATQAELAEEIRNSTTQTRKGIDEVLGKIKALEDVIAAGAPVSPELQAAVAELSTATQALDAIVPDAPPA